MVLSQSGAFMVGICWYWVITGWYCSVLCVTGSVSGGTWWYWVSMERYWLMYSTESVEGDTGW